MNPQRHQELLCLWRIPHVQQGDTLWFLNQGVARPWGPACRNYDSGAAQADRARAALKAHLAVYTSGFLQDATTEWYAVVCDRFSDLEAMPSKYRSEVRRALRNCQVQRVEPAYLAEHAYGVFAAAVATYTHRTYALPSEAEFRQGMIAQRDFGDVVHHWGVFHGQRLVGFSQNIVYDQDEVNYSSIKLHPDYLKLYSSYALIYCMNQHYLASGTAYVNDGWRGIQHETHFQDFLIRKFGFRKAYTRLRVRYTPMLAVGMRLCFPFRTELRSLHPKLNALLRLEEFQRKCVGSGT